MNRIRPPSRLCRGSSSSTLSRSPPDGSTGARGRRLTHAVPHYRAPGWIADGGLAAEPTPGLVDIDPYTLRSRRHESIWAIGDAADVATRPSGSLQRYDGYTVMPITVSRRKLVLNEVDRDGRPSPSVPFLNPFKPRRWQWLFDRYGLPQVYWRRILRGRV